MKVCTKCRIEKDINLFHISRVARDGRCTWCRQCKAMYDSEYQKKNMAKISQNTSRWYHRNRDKMVLWHKEYNRVNHDRIYAKVKANRKKNRKMLSDYEKNRRASDPLHRMIRNCRVRLCHLMARNGWQKPGKTEEMLGADYNRVKAWLESQFTAGMSWSNYGSGWHIDHKIPLCSAISIADLAPLVHYKNLQPLWASDNLHKSRKIIS